MKKINRKGFTLIELLAVIVIMAIILVVTVPNIINSINDARLNSLHNLAVSVVNAYNTAYAQDLIAPDEDSKVLGALASQVNEEWQCIGYITSGTKTLAGVLGLSESEVILENSDNAECSTKPGSVAAGDCSSIRINNYGNVEVILVAADDGRFDVAGKHVYAYSEDTEAKTVEY